MIKIERDKIVSLRYILKNSNGDILENIMNLPAVKYLHGSARIDASLQEKLEGLKPGEEKTISLTTGQSPNELYFIFDIIIDEVIAASEDEILQGFPLEVKTSSCGPGCLC